MRFGVRRNFARFAPSEAQETPRGQNIWRRPITAAPDEGK